MAWCAIHEKVVDHPKTRKLMKLLRVSRHEAIGILAALWLWGLHNADRLGRLRDATARDIADGMLYRKRPEVLIDALLESEWLDQQGEEYIIHDWQTWQAEWFKALDRREANTAAVQRYRGRT